MPTTNYIWDKQNYLAEADGSSTIQTVYTNEPEQYGNLISSRISGTTSYHHFDALGSTRQLTNAPGTVTDTMTYDAWGNAVSRSGSTPTTRLWVGVLTYYTDPETGLVWIIARPYGPMIARSTTVDPAEDSTRGYTYVNNVATLFVDPSGLACRPPSVTPNAPPPGLEPDKPYEPPARTCRGFCFNAENLQVAICQVQAFKLLTGVREVCNPLH